MALSLGPAQEALPPSMFPQPGRKCQNCPLFILQTVSANCVHAKVLAPGSTSGQAKGAQRKQPELPGL